MNNNEWHSWKAPGQQPSQLSRYYQPHAPRPQVPETVLDMKYIQVEQKVFAVGLKENARGRFLRITEEANNKFTTVIIPAAGLEDLQTVINGMVKLNQDTPPTSEG